MLHVSLFGGLTFADAQGAPAPTITLQQRAAALLAVLAVAHPRPVSRDKLVALLWPEADSESARHSLSQALYRLRTDLGCAEPVLAAAELSINPAALHTDLQEFESAESAKDFDRAARLYQGPLLDGFHLANAPEFERWLDRQREDYRSRALRILGALGDAADRRSDAGQVIEYGKRLLGIARTDVAATLRVARAMSEQGDLTAALQCIRDHETAMREELELGPDSRIIELSYEILRAHRRAAAKAAAAAAITTPPSTTPPSSVADRPRSPPRRRLADRRRPLLALLAASLAIAALIAVGWGKWRGAVPAGNGPRSPLSADPGAVQAYTQARHLWRQRSHASLDEAITYFETATNRDPNFAEAFAGMASVYVVLPWFGGDQTEDWARARIAADRAIALDPKLAEAFAVRAYGEGVYDWTFAAADSDYRTALALRPDEATTHQWYGTFLCARRRCAEGLAELQHAKTLDPLAPMIGTEIAIARYLMDQPDSAIVDFLTVARATPDFSLAYVGLAEAQLQKGDVAAARSAIDRARGMTPDDPSVLAVAAVVYARQGDDGAAAAAVANFERQRSHASVAPSIVAISRLGAHDRRGAVTWLLRAIDTHDRYLGGGGPDPIMRELSGDSVLEAHLAGAGIHWGYPPTGATVLAKADPDPPGRAAPHPR